ncbi:hypothetical protein [Photobacterium profundum]|uniref:Uncharacterized protein n=1 Tax=Photobacterium profundum (strain SS9) TaxID=298386 RepID=Q6LJ05_PHOPR|nr:hypothetical protein [Photobacterium profundum]CAG22725.1 hypothetical protein PBPRB0853 [Photobacterium profundum SS9]
MKNSIKTTLTAFVLATSYNVAAADGDFTGNVSFEQPQAHATQAKHFINDGTPENYNSGIVLQENTAQFTFAEQLNSARDK